METEKPSEETLTTGVEDRAHVTSRSAHRCRMMGLPLDSMTMTEAVQEVRRRLADDHHPHQICFVNAHCINVGCADPVYRNVLHEADLVFADGIGVKLAGMALGVHIADNVNGTDMFPELCAALSETERKIYLLGATPGTPEAVCDWIKNHYPDLKVAGCQHGYFSSAEEADVIQRIAESESDLLLVALGVPRQDVWIHHHLPFLNVRIAIGVGGLFDFYSGRIPRAPRWMRRARIEWGYRLFQEPARLWRRYVLGNPRFLARVACERLQIGHQR